MVRISYGIWGIILFLCAILLLISFRAKAVDLNWRTKAQLELEVGPDKKTQDVLSTPATVRSQIEKIESPLRYTAIQMGLALQSFTPKGRGEVVGQAPVDWSSEGDILMPSLEVRWLPLMLSDDWVTGGFLSFGYGMQNLKIQTPTGREFAKTRLHSTRAQAGWATEYHFMPHRGLSLVGQLGIGQLNEVQSSVSEFARASERLNYLNMGLLLEKRVLRSWKAFAGYDLRLPQGDQSDRIQIQQNNFLVGVLGSFQ